MALLFGFNKKLKTKQESLVDELFLCAHSLHTQLIHSEKHV